MNELKGDLYAIGAALSWAVAVIFFRFSGYYFKTIPLKLIQNTAALIFFILSLFLLNQPLFPIMSTWEWSLVLLSALIGITLGDTFYVAALNRIGAGAQALLDCLYSPFLIWLAFMFFGETLGLYEWVGAALVISSILVGTAHRQKADRPVDRKDWVIGFIFGVLSQLAMAICVIMVRDVLKGHSVLTITTYRFLFGNGLLVVYIALTQSSAFRFKKSDIPPLLKWVLPGTFLGPFLSTLFWFAGFKYTLAGRAAVYNQLSTIFILILAAWFLNERLTLNKILAIALAVAGGVLVSSA